MKTHVSEAHGQTLGTLTRCLGALVLLAMGFFCGFGFLASFEPGNGLLWKIAYGTLACGFLVGAIALLRAAFVNGGETDAGESLNRRLVRMVLCAIVGGVVLLVLQWHFAHAWGSYYSRFPWQGYQQAMQQGRVPAFLTSSPRSLLVGCVVLFWMPFVAFHFGRLLRSSLALWVGVMGALVAVWVGTPQLRQDSNLWPIDLVLLSFITALPMIAGASLVWLIQQVAGILRKR